MMNKMTKYLTTTQAAARLGLSESRVRQFCQVGWMGRKIGRNWAITETELAAFKRINRPAGNPNWAK